VAHAVLPEPLVAGLAAAAGEQDGGEEDKADGESVGRPWYDSAVSRGGSPDPPRTCVISLLGGNCLAAGQETRRAPF